MRSSTLLLASFLAVVPGTVRLILFQLGSQSAHTYESIYSQPISATPTRLESAREADASIKDSFTLSNGHTYNFKGCIR